MVTDPRPQTPEETVAAWLGAMVASISAMPPADRARAHAALDVHAAMFLMHGVQTAAGATAAHELLSTLLVEILPAAEAKRFAAGAPGAAPAGGPLRIEIELPNGGSTLTLDHVAQVLVAVVVNMAAICPALQLRSAVGRDAAGRLLLAVTADGRADDAPGGDAASLPGGAPDILSQAQEIARAAWAGWTAPGPQAGDEA